MTRKTRCTACGCHEFDKTSDGTLQTWTCIDCGAVTPRTNGKQLAQRKTKLTFETSAAIKERGEYRAVIVEPTPLIVVLRLKGMRRIYEVSWEGIYHFAAKVAADRAKAEKKAKRRKQ